MHTALRYCHHEGGYTVIDWLVAGLVAVLLMSTMIMPIQLLVAHTSFDLITIPNTLPEWNGWLGLTCAPLAMLIIIRLMLVSKS